MPNLNKVMLMGNLTRDVEMTYTPKGMAIGKFGLAVNRKYKTESGEQKDETTFVDITLFGRTAEIASQYLSKGKPAFIEGRLQLDTWDDKQSGQKRSKLYVVGDAMQLIGGRDGGGGGGGNYEGGGASASSEDFDQRPAPRQQPSSGGGSGGGGYSGGNAGGNQQRPKPKPAPAPVQDDDDDIPF